MLQSQHQHATTVDEPEMRKAAKLWSDGDVDILVNARCQTNPPTFQHIAAQINMMNSRLGVSVDRQHTETTCRNKWMQMFPSSEDANKTIAWLTYLKKCWPSLHFRTESSPSNDGKSPPVLTGIYIVWPWSRVMMETLSPSIFCDATFEVTIFNYKIVFITTLDGNKQHRPLMCSFILRSVAAQWAKIFNIFNLYV